MEINKQIKIMIEELTGNNIPCAKCTITKAYEDSTLCDIKTEYGTYKMVNCNRQASVDDTGLLVFLDGDMSKPYVLVTKDAEYVCDLSVVEEDLVLDLCNQGGHGEQADTTKPTNEIIESYELNNLGTQSGANQSEINQAINTKIGQGGGGSVIIDDQLSTSSTNPVQNKIITNALNGKSDVNHNHDDLYYTKNSTDTLLNNKQDNLVSGTNIKTINNQSILGSGDLTINPQIIIDDALSYDSSNPVENKVITNALSLKAPFSHAHTTNRYGLGDTDYYGHVKIINNLLETSYTDGLVLSAYQGYVLKTLIDAKSDFSGSYNDLTDKPTIPSKTSDITNDSGFITSSDITGKEDKSNKVTDWNQTPTDTNYPSEKLVKDSLDGKSDTNHNHNDLYYTETETNTLLNSKQDNLVSGTNIKTINNQSIIGSGNLTINEFSGDYDDLTNKPTIPSKTSDLTNDGDGTNVFVKDNDARLSDARTPLSHNHDDRYYTENETDTLLDTKQDNLVSGTNIKTINNQSLLGSGNIDISGGGTVDDQLDNTSTNPVQNKVITNALDSKSDFSGDYNDLTNKPDVINYQLTSNDYNPDINGTFTLTLKVTDIYGDPISNHNAGTLKENGYNVYDTSGNQIGASMITDSNGECSVTIPCYNLQSELYLQNNNSEAMLWSLRDYSVGDAHCQVQAEGWYYYYNTSTYKLSRNGYLARFSLHGWSTSTVLTSTSWTNFGGSTAYASNIIPSNYVIMLNSGCNAYFRINTNGTIVCRAVSSNVASGTSHYGMVTWSCDK